MKESDNVANEYVNSSFKKEVKMKTCESEGCHNPVFTERHCTKHMPV